MAIKYFQEYWETRRTKIVNMTQKDIPHLQQLLQILYDKTNWEIISGELYHPKYFEQLIHEPPLPPNGKKEYVQNQSIFDFHEQSYIGWLELYHGYPMTNILWIGAFFLHPNIHHTGYGQEIVTGLIEQAQRLNTYHAIQLSVYLRNWSALRFWSKMGFNTIKRFSGDKEFGPDKQCAVALELSFDDSNR